MTACPARVILLSFLLILLTPLYASSRTVADAEFYYKVKPGDSFSAILVKVLKLRTPSLWKTFGPAVADFNRMPDMDLIYPGQTIRFPAVRVTEPGQTDLKILVQRYFGGDWSRRSDLVLHRSGSYFLIIRDIRFLREGVIP